MSPPWLLIWRIKMEPIDWMSAVRFRADCHKLVVMPTRAHICGKWILLSLLVIGVLDLYQLRPSLLTVFRVFV
jgi:hypothetical protein